MHEEPDDSVHTFTGHTGELYTVTCSPTDATLVATGGGDDKGFLWRIGRGDWAFELQGHPYHTEGLTCMAISSDSTLAITSSKDGSVGIVNITTGRVVSKLNSHSDSIECVGFAPSSGPSSLWAATGGMDQKLIIWDLQHSMPRSTCEHEDAVTCLTWLGASSYLVTGCVDGKVRLWDGRSGDCIRTFSGHTGTIQSLSVPANRDFLVSVSLDETARVFEIAEFL